MAHDVAWRLLFGFCCKTALNKNEANCLPKQNPLTSKRKGRNKLYEFLMPFYKQKIRTQVVHTFGSLGFVCEEHIGIVKPQRDLSGKLKFTNTHRKLRISTVSPHTSRMQRRDTSNFGIPSKGRCDGRQA